MSLWRSLLDLLYPPACLACRRPTPAPGFCSTCRAAIRTCTAPGCRRCGTPFLQAALVEYDCSRCGRRPPAYRRARARALYRSGGPAADPLPAVLQRYKYGRDVTLAPVLGDLVAEAELARGGDYDLIVPVPLHRERLRWRGFNQSLLLARHIARRIDTPVAPRLLCRTRPTAPQVDLDEKARQANVAGAFAVAASDARRLRDRRILLVDDVLTTGATVDECSKALRRGGAAVVDVLVLARAADV